MKAKLVQDKTRDGFRAIVEHENSNNSFYPSYPNVSELVEVIPAQDHHIRFFLNEILINYGVENAIIKNVEKLSDVFYKEIASFPLVDNKLTGALAYNETSVGSKFYLIINKV